MKGSLLSRVDSRLIGLFLVGILFFLSYRTSKFLGVHLFGGFFALLIMGLLCLLVWVLFQKEAFRAKDDPESLKLGTFESSLPGFGGEPFFLQPSKIRHVLVTGVTGSGKSTFIRRYIDEILRTGKRFCYFDFKGEQKDHEENIRICEFRGVRDELQIFDLSDPKNCLGCNLLTINRGVEETVGFIIGLFFGDDANEYYRNEAERFLRFSIQLLDASGTKRNFIHINEIYSHPSARATLLNVALKRVDPTEAFFLYFESEFDQLSARDRSERFSGFTAILSSFLSEPFRTIFNGLGKKELNIAEMFDKNIPTIIRVPGEAYGELSVRIIQSFIQLIPVLLARRRLEENRSDYFVLLDEGCSYVNETLSDILKKAGSAQVKVLLTRMSDADFDSVAPSFLGKMLSAFSVFVCFQTNDPDTRETMSRLSMTLDDVKFTAKIGSEGETGEGSRRDVQRFTIHPTSFGRLRTGECYVIAPSLNIFRKAQVSPARSLS